jgi:outer membrane protein W
MKRLLALLATLSASPALAQGLEVSVVGGYTTSGGLTPRAAGITDLKLAGNWGAGASVGYFVSPRLGFEASWLRQQSGLEIANASGSGRMFDADIDQIHGSVVWQFTRERSQLRPFVAAGIGASVFSAPQLQDETKLSLSLGAGLRWTTVASKVGARLQVHYTPIHLNDSGSEFCDPFGFCQGWLNQIAVTGGVVVGF